MSGNWTRTFIAVAGLTLPLGFAGCRDNTPPPARVFVPNSNERDAMALRDSDHIRPNPAPPPLPIDRPPFHDAPIVEQAVPEEAAFVDQYRRVGSPKILLFVNRTLQGDVLPVNTDEPSVTVTHTQSSNGPVDVSSSASASGSAHAYGYGWYDAHGEYHASSSEKFSSKTAAKYTDSTDVYLHPGQYDEVQARSLDYEAIENIMTDWIASQGQVTVVSPSVARQRLTDEQVKDLQQGRPQVMSEIAQQLNTDILIQVQARPTRQTEQGLEVRLVAEALNTHGGQSLARATVDMEPPLDKPAINQFTRFLARKLMTDMTRTWNAPPPPEMRSSDSAAPTAAPPTPGSATPTPSQSATPAPTSGSHGTMPPLFAPAPVSATPPDPIHADPTHAAPTHTTPAVPSATAPATTMPSMQLP